MLTPVSATLRERTPVGALCVHPGDVRRAWIGTFPVQATVGDILSADGEFVNETTVHVHNVQVRAKASDLARSYLEHFVRGVGPKLAERIVEELGPGALDRLAEGAVSLSVPERLAPELRRACQSSDRVVLGSLALFGLNAYQAKQAIRTWGERALSRALNYPFDLLHCGVDFRTADRLHQQLGGTPDDPARHQALIPEVLARQGAEHGHTRLHPGQMSMLLQDGHALSDAEATKALTSNPFVAVSLEHLYLPARLTTERELASRVQALMRSTIDRRMPLSVKPVALTDEQWGAVVRTRDHAVTVLTGGPGTGKSTAVRAVADAAVEANLRLLLAAPTGKAAARLAEATGREAQTLHRLLGFTPKGWTFHTLNLLPADVVIVDEASMIDDTLMLGLLNAVREGARLVIVGDPFQLPPIEPGLPLRALMEVAATTRLTRVFRQASGSPIIRLAYDLLDGELDFEEIGLPVQPVRSAVEAADLARELGAQLLAPARKGPLGIEALNAAMQSRLGRRGGVNVTGGRLHVGDPAACIRNDYTKGVMNGMVGEVEDLNRDTGVLTVNFPDVGRVGFGSLERTALMPAYAMTVHRAQGSEWPKVACVLDESHGVMLTRTLAYTAVTRAKKELLLLGTEQAWHLAAARVAPARASGLEERIRS